MSYAWAFPALFIIMVLAMVYDHYLDQKYEEKDGCGDSDLHRDL